MVDSLYTKNALNAIHYLDGRFRSLATRSDRLVDTN